MPTVLRVEDLHEAYGTASKEDAIAMANLGAICYQSVKEGLFAQWSTAEDAAKADTWREEGRQSMFETLKSKLAAAEGMSVRLLAAETALEEAHAAMETRISGRVAETLDSFRKDYELVKMKEIAAMQQRIAAAEAREEMIEMVKKGNAAMEEKIEHLNVELEKYKEANSTKSSYAIGKEGESTIQELFEASVIPWFASARIENMSATGHAGDFHLYVMSHLGKLVKLLIDVKKYKESVRTKEIEKLHADVDADADAVGGMLISLNSNIMGSAHFHIDKTPLHKPCIHLVLKDITEELRGKILLWASRILASLNPEGRIGDEDTLHKEVLLFMKELNLSVKDADATVKSCSKTLESAKASRDGIIRRMTDFRARILMEDAEEPASPSVVDASRCTFTKGDGSRCKNRRIGGLDVCKSHKPK